MKKKTMKWLLFCICMLFLCGCSDLETEEKNHSKPEIEKAEEPVIPEKETEPEEEEATEISMIEEFMEEMTLEEKVSQLFIVRPDALDPAQEEGAVKVTEAMQSMLEKYPVGGVCQFGKNIVSPEQLKQFNRELQEASKIPLLIAVDEEGGLVARLANHQAFDLPQYENAAAVGENGDAEAAKDMGKTIGKYLAEYGFTMDFAPVADVNTNPENPIIGTRAFSSDAQTAAKMVSAVAEGLREEGILPTLKHFPGHGDTMEDSHTSLAVTKKTLEELQECEFLPFEEDQGVHAVMVGHIAAPNVTGNDLPSSLCAEMIALIPDKEHCLIITDSLEMQAISEKYASGEAAVLAMEAGCDLLLMPVDLSEAHEAVLQAVEEGRVRMERLDQSVKKILTYKEQLIGEIQ